MTSESEGDESIRVERHTIRQRIGDEHADRGILEGVLGGDDPVRASLIAYSGLLALLAGSGGYLLALANVVWNTPVSVQDLASAFPDALSLLTVAVVTCVVFLLSIAFNATLRTIEEVSESDE